MTQPPDPPLPPFGTPPYVPPPQQQWAPPQPRRESNTVDIALSWVLYVIHVLATLVLGVISLFSIFLTDSCGSSQSDLAVCDTDFFGSVLIGYWIALVVLVVGVPVALVVAAVRDKPCWPWAVGGFGGLVVATVVYFALISQ